MNNIFVYIENEGGKAAEVCLELMTKGRELATTLGVKLEAVVLGENLAGIEHELAKYGADTVWIADDKVFAPFRTLPHTAVMCGLIEQEKPQIVLFGATCNGRDFAPRVSSALYSGLTADCTQLVIGDHKDAKSGREYKDLLYQIRPGHRPRRRYAPRICRQAGCRRGEEDPVAEIREGRRPRGEDHRP